MSKAEDRAGATYLGELFWAAVGGLTSLALTLVSTGLAHTFAFWSVPLLCGLLIVGLTRVVVGWHRWRKSKPRWKEGNPYPGLLPYDSNFAPVFCGREEEIDALFDRVRRSTDVTRRFIPVVGPSGAGKSSIVRAGLLARISEHNQRNPSIKVLGPIRPGTSLFAALGEQLLAERPTEEVGAFVAKLRAEARDSAVALSHNKPLPSPVQLVARLRELIQRRPWWWLLLGRGRAGRVVLILDQLEEVMLDEAGQGADVVALFEGALRAFDGLIVVATIRSDQLGAFQGAPGSDLMRHPLMINIMTYGKLRTVVTEPAAATGINIDNALVDLIVEDAAKSADALPIMSLVLHELYGRNAILGRTTKNDAIFKGKTITREQYDVAIGEHGIITQLAENAIDSLSAGDIERDRASWERTTLNTMLNFVSVDRAGSIARQQVWYKVLSSLDQLVVDEFVKARLLGISVVGNEPVVDIAHDALLRNWRLLASFIESRLPALQARTRLVPFARDWKESGRKASHLLSASRVQEVRGEMPTDALVKEFLDASIAGAADEISMRADAAGREALRAIPTDPEKAIQLARAAVAINETVVSASAFYSAWATGLRAASFAGTGISSLAWSPDGRFGVGLDNGAVLISSAVGDSVSHSIQAADAPVLCLAWSADGLLAIASADGTMRVLNPRPSVGGASIGLDELFWVRDTGAILALAWAPDGRLASGGATKDVHIWTSGGRLLKTLKGHTGTVHAAAWSENFGLATASADGSAIIWTESGDIAQTFVSQSGPVNGLTWLGDGRLATASEDGITRIWTQAGLTSMHQGDGSPGWSIACSADGFIAMGTRDGWVHVWAADGSPIRSIRASLSSVRALAWTSDGRLMSGGSDRCIREWAPPVQWIARYAKQESALWALAWSNDGSLAGGGEDGSIVVWTEGGRRLLRMNEHSACVRSVAWSQDNRLATASLDGTVKIWSHDGQLLQKLIGQAGTVVAMSWSEDGRLATSSSDRTVRIWDSSGQHIETIDGIKSVILSLAWSPDGRLAGGDERRHIHLWDGSGEPLGTLSGHTSAVSSLAWSAEGRLASVSFDHTLRIWSNRGEPVHVIMAHDLWIRAVAWSRDGHLATASDDRSVRVWSSEGAPLLVLNGHEEAAYAVSWSLDGRLASSYADGTVLIWPRPMPVAELEADASHARLRPLSDDESRQAMLINDYSVHP